MQAPATTSSITQVAEIEPMSVDVGTEGIGIQKKEGGAGESDAADMEDEETAEHEVKEAAASKEADDVDEEKEQEQEQEQEEDGAAGMGTEELLSNAEVGESNNHSERRSSADPEVQVLESLPSTQALRQCVPHLRTQLVSCLEELNDFYRSFPPDEQD